MVKKLVGGLLVALVAAGFFCCGFYVLSLGLAGG